jgi:Histidine kinase-like ATPase domain
MSQGPQVASAEATDRRYGERQPAPAKPVLSGPGRRRRIALVPAPESVKAARDFTAATLRRWHLTALIDDAVVIASELATNAIRHGTPSSTAANCPEGSAALADDRAGATGPAGAATPAGAHAGVMGPAGAADSAAPPGIAGRVELTWCLQASRLICVVTDQAGAPPTLAPEDPEAESGHGLQIVGALAVAWGWTILSTGEKAVWAALEYPGADVRANRATVRDMRAGGRAADPDRRGPSPAARLFRAACWRPRCGAGAASAPS